MSYKPVSYSYAEFKKILLANPNTAQEYENLADEFSLISELIRARKHAGKTQNDIANVMHTSSSMISRLESLAGQKKHSPTIETLKKYAKAVNCRLAIKLVPLKV